MKLEDMILTSKNNLHILDSLKDSQRYELNDYGVNTLYEVMLQNSKNDLVGDEQELIYNMFDDFLVKGQYKAPHIQQGRLTSISLELLQTCNLRCNHCYLTNDKIKNRIDLFTLNRILKEGKTLGAYVLDITGGEILLDKSLTEKINLARFQNYKVSVTTNATLMTEEIAKEFKRLNVYLTTVTLNGNKEQHEEIYGKNTYYKTIKGLDILHKLKIPIGINFMRTDSNKDSEKEFENEMKSKYNIKNFTPANIRNRGSAKINNLLGIPIVDESTKYKASCGQDYDKGLTCGAGKDSLFIKSDGSVTPCIEQDISVGNIHVQSLNDIYASMMLKRGYY